MSSSFPPPQQQHHLPGINGSDEEEDENEGEDNSSQLGPRSPSPEQNNGENGGAFNNQGANNGGIPVLPDGQPLLEEEDVGPTFPRAHRSGEDYFMAAFGGGRGGFGGPGDDENDEEEVVVGEEVEIRDSGDVNWDGRRPDSRATDSQLNDEDLEEDLEGGGIPLDAQSQATALTFENDRFGDDPFVREAATIQQGVRRMSQFSADGGDGNGMLSFSQQSFSISQSQPHFTVDDDDDESQNNPEFDQSFATQKPPTPEAGEGDEGERDEGDFEEQPPEEETEGGGAKDGSGGEENANDGEEEGEEPSYRPGLLDDDDLFDRGSSGGGSPPPPVSSPAKKKKRIVASDNEEGAEEGAVEGGGEGGEGDEGSQDASQEKGEGEDGEGDETGDLDTSKLMKNIFGDEDLSDDDAEGQKEGGEEQVEGEEGQQPPLPSSDEEGPRRGPNDFDEMMHQKRQERRRKRRHNRRGDFDLISDADDIIKAMVDAMNDAANDDRMANMERRPATRKLLMLPQVRHMLLKADLFDAMLDNGMISAISEWLAPLPDKSLPALEIRTTLLNILEGFNTQLEQGILKQSGIGKAVMFLFKHPKEIRENKQKAARLIREWSRPIFQLDTDFRSLTREERVQRDFLQMPEVKRAKIRVDSEGLPIPSSPPQRRGSVSDDHHHHQGTSSGTGANAIDPITGKKPIMRARVPKISTKDYVIRPKSEIEGTFRGSTKKQMSSFDRRVKEFKERTKAHRRSSLQAVSVSLEGRKLI